MEGPEQYEMEEWFYFSFDQKFIFTLKYSGINITMLIVVIIPGCGI